MISILTIITVNSANAAGVTLTSKINGTCDERGKEKRERDRSQDYL
jgi:hypothetical protein